MACEDQVTSQDLENAKDDSITIAEIATSRAGGASGGALIDNTTTRLGDTVSTLRGQLAKLGYEVPVAYASGISFTVDDSAKTVEESGIVYAPLVSELPFTTSGTWVGDDDARFRVVNQENLSGQVATNTANIATNTANIATNTANIATNTADIATNTADIATNAADIAAKGINIGTPVASTSGTSIDFTGIPAGVKRLTFNFYSLSASASGGMILQLGGSSGFSNSGYLSNLMAFGTSENYTLGIPISAAGDGNSVIINGCIEVNLLNSTSYIYSGGGEAARSDAAQGYSVGFSKSLGEELTQIRLTTRTGTPTFDLGEVNISWEF